jgi:hypothetical protein
MSYQVSEEGTFNDLTKPEADALYSGVEALMKGERQDHLYSVFESWCKATGLSNTAINLAMTFPLNALLSLVRYYR